MSDDDTNTRLADLLPPEESLDDSLNGGSSSSNGDRQTANGGFRATLRPQFAALNVALNLATLEAPADAKNVPLHVSKVTRADLAAVLGRRRDFDRAAVRAALDAAHVAQPPDGHDPAALSCFQAQST